MVALSRVRRFCGLIDFGDAFISHPALDLRRWQAAEDRAALLDGYQVAGELDPSFLATWRVEVILADLTEIAEGRDRQNRAQQNLQALLGELYPERGFTCLCSAQRPPTRGPLRIRKIGAKGQN